MSKKKTPRKKHKKRIMRRPHYSISSLKDKLKKLDVLEREIGEMQGPEVSVLSVGQLLEKMKGFVNEYKDLNLQKKEDLTEILATLKQEKNDIKELEQEVKELNPHLAASIDSANDARDELESKITAHLSHNENSGVMDALNKLSDIHHRLGEPSDGSLSSIGRLMKIDQELSSLGENYPSIFNMDTINEKYLGTTDKVLSTICELLELESTSKFFGRDPAWMEEQQEEHWSLVKYIECSSEKYEHFILKSIKKVEMALSTIEEMLFGEINLIIDLYLALFSYNEIERIKSSLHSVKFPEKSTFLTEIDSKNINGLQQRAYQHLIGKRSPDLSELEAGNKRLEEMDDFFKSQRNLRLWASLGKRSAEDKPAFEKFTKGFFEKLIKVHPFSAEYNKDKYNECLSLYHDFLKGIEQGSQVENDDKAIAPPRIKGFELLESMSRFNDPSECPGEIQMLEKLSHSFSPEFKCKSLGTYLTITVNQKIISIKDKIKKIEKMKENDDLFFTFLCSNAECYTDIVAMFPGLEYVKNKMVEIRKNIDASWPASESQVVDELLKEYEAKHELLIPVLNELKKSTYAGLFNEDITTSQAPEAGYSKLLLIKQHLIKNHQAIVTKFETNKNYFEDGVKGKGKNKYISELRGFYKNMKQSKLEFFLLSDIVQDILAIPPFSSEYNAQVREECIKEANEIANDIEKQHLFFRALVGAHDKTFKLDREEDDPKPNISITDSIIAFMGKMEKTPAADVRDYDYWNKVKEEDSRSGDFYDDFNKALNNDPVYWRAKVTFIEAHLLPQAIELFKERSQPHIKDTDLFTLIQNATFSYNDFNNILIDLDNAQVYFQKTKELSEVKKSNIYNDVFADDALELEAKAVQLQLKAKSQLKVALNYLFGEELSDPLKESAGHLRLSSIHNDLIKEKKSVSKLCQQYKDRYDSIKDSSVTNEVFYFLSEAYERIKKENKDLAGTRYIFEQMLKIPPCDSPYNSSIVKQCYEVIEEMNSILVKYDQLFAAEFHKYDHMNSRH